MNVEGHSNTSRIDKWAIDQRRPNDVFDCETSNTSYTSKTNVMRHWACHNNVTFRNVHN